MGTQENNHRDKSEKNPPKMVEFMDKLYESTIEAAQDFSVIYREEQKKEASDPNAETQSHPETR